MPDRKEYTDDTDTPAWLEKEMVQMPKPDEAVFHRFEYLKQDFIESFTKWAEKKRGDSPHLVFSLAGRLIRKAGEIITEAMTSRQPLNAYAIRGASPQEDSKDEQPARANAYILPLRNARVEAFVFSRGNRTILEINLIFPHSDKEIRPFRVLVSDEHNRLIDERTIRQGELPPKYFDPEKGHYRFSITWEGCHAELLINFE